MGQSIYDGRFVMSFKCVEKRRAYDKAYKEANKEELAAYKKAWYQANKEKIAAKHKAYYEANKKEITDYKRSYQKANKEEIASKRKRYYEANKEKIAAKHKTYSEANKEEIAAYRRSYKKANKERYASMTARRKALKLKQIPVHLRECPHEKKRLVQIYKLRNILSEATGVQHHVDHMWPLADGGPHWSGNLQVIPAEENLSKSASVCEETKTTIIKSLYTFESERSI